MPFSEFDLHPELLRGVRELGFTRPTPIQAQAIPPGMQGKDLLACAMTGSGKTVAFLLPILNRLMTEKRGRTRALIVTPTRELAAQIEQSLNDLAVHTPLSCASVFGGVGPGPQEHAFRAGVDVIIATPGRLLDHMKQPYVNFEHLKFLVLDEADRMLDMGFLPDIKRILRALPAKKQTMLFSATMPGPIAELTKTLLHNPVTIDLERRAAPAIGITQAVYSAREDVKPYLLMELIRRGDVKDAIVFTRTKHRTNRLSELLTKHGIGNARMHGNRSQAQRVEALEGFKTGAIKVLIATDIVARGIDVEALSHVVNFDVPHVPEDYIHRVGRTARAGLTGEAFTLVSPEEEADLRAIEKAVGKRLPRVTLPGFDYEMRPAERFEVPIGERIAAIRERKREERARAKEKADRKAQREAEQASGRGGRGGGRSSEGPRRAIAGERPASVGGRGPGGGGQLGARPAGQGAASGAGSRRGRGGRGRGPAGPRGGSGGGGSSGGGSYR